MKLEVRKVWVHPHDGVTCPSYAQRTVDAAAPNTPAEGAQAASIQPADRAESLLHALVLATRERKLAQQLKDDGILRAAETQFARAWSEAADYVEAGARVRLTAALARRADAAMASGNRRK